MSIRQKLGPVEDRMLILLFIVALSLPALGMLLHLDGDTTMEEKRLLAPFPHISLSRAELESFPEQFKLYFQDHFGFRKTLIRWQAIVRVKWLGVSPAPQRVILGKEGWLFATDGQALEFYRGLRPFTQEQLAGWQRLLERRRDWLAQRGVYYLFTIPPYKHTVYPEYMPSEIKRIREESRLDQLVAYLKEHSDIQVLDLRPVLLEAKKYGRLYYRTDTHWNKYGAFVGYQAIMNEVAKSFPELRPLTESDFDIRTHVGPGGNLVDKLGMRGSIEDEIVNLRAHKPLKARRYKYEADPRSDYQLVAFEQKDSNLPHLVMFRDSFADNMIPYLSEHFSRAVYIWDKDMNLNPRFIASEHPDIVIQEMVELRLMYEPPKDPDLTSLLDSR